MADELGWSRESVKDHVALERILPDAWKIIGATFQSVAPGNGNGSAPDFGAGAPFTENLLRAIVLLTASQQLELVTNLVPLFRVSALMGLKMSAPSQCQLALSPKDFSATSSLLLLSNKSNWSGGRLRVVRRSRRWRMSWGGAQTL